MTKHTGGAWRENWQTRIYDRIEAQGFSRMCDYLCQFPSVPYYKVAARLGADVAAFQIEWLHAEEARLSGEVRGMAMDSMARDLNTYLENGWKSGPNSEFNAAQAYAAWATRLQQCQNDLAKSAARTWDSLESLEPIEGWSPKGADDPIIQMAFETGWIT